MDQATTSQRLIRWNNLTYEKSITSNTLDRKDSDVQDVPRIIFSEVPDENENENENDNYSHAKPPLPLHLNKLNLTANRYELGIIPEESSIANTPATIMNKKNHNRMTKYEFVRCKTQLHVGDDLEDLISEVNLLSINNNKKPPTKELTKGFSKISNPSENSIKSSNSSSQKQLKRVLSKNFDQK